MERRLEVSHARALHKNAPDASVGQDALGDAGLSHQPGVVGVTGGHRELNVVDRTGSVPGVASGGDERIMQCDDCGEWLTPETVNMCKMNAGCADTDDASGPSRPCDGILCDDCLPRHVQGHRIWRRQQIIIDAYHGDRLSLDDMHKLYAECIY